MKLAKTISTLTESETKSFLRLLPRYLIKTGSVIRSERAHDIDLITTKDLSVVERYFKKVFGELYHKVGLSKLVFFQIKFQNKLILINIWHATENNKNIIKFLHDYPRGFIIGIRKKLKSCGYKLGADAVYKGKERLNIITPRQIFMLADIQYRTPQQEQNKR